MWIVRLALRNPYSVAVMALVLLIMGGLSIATMLVDIFPIVDIPVVSVIWSYPGLSSEDMERRIVTITERAMSTTVQGVSSIESQSIPGIGNVRVHFQPGTDIGSAVAQVSSVCQTILRILPPGITPPNILPFNASNVPVAQLTVTSDSASEQAMFDYALNFVRIQLFTIPGLSTPAPYGGSNREINVDVDPQLASARGVSPQDLSNTIQNSNLILPTGIARIGKTEYNVQTNASPTKIDDFDHFPVKVVNGREVTLGDVARVQDSHADQTNIVRINGKRSIYLNIIKKQDASTIAVVNAVKKLLPSFPSSGPGGQGMNFKLDFDQSTFVRASVSSVLREAILAAILVSLMILLFLGSWQSVIIVCTSIPLSIFCSVIALKLTGNSINIMTLGGLALSIGMLVDDATVEIENINRNRSTESNITSAILHGASQIALPAIVTTLSVCIVFFPIVMLTGPAKFLFVPLSEAVVFAMVASYILSRTLVPVLSRILLRNAPIDASDEDTGGEKKISAQFKTPFHAFAHWLKDKHEHLEHDTGDTDTHADGAKPKRKKRPHGRFAKFTEHYNQKREEALGHLKESYGNILGVFLANPRTTVAAGGVLFVISLALPFFIIGEDFFPATDVGILKLHFRATPGIRIEETEKLIEQAEERIRSLIPSDELETVNVNIGVPTSYNLAFVPTDNAASMDAEILVALKEKHHPSELYREKIRKDFAEQFPGSVVYFQPADIVSQVLNFGLSAPVDVQIQARDSDKAYEYAKKLRDKMFGVAGATDVVIKQILDYPGLRMDVDRERAAQLGLSEKDVASSVLVSLSSSSLVQPSYYISPENGVNYPVVVKVPFREITSVAELLRVPATGAAANAINQTSDTPTTDYPHNPAQSLGNLVAVKSTSTYNEINHQDVQRILDVTASVEGRDLGAVVKDVQKEIKRLGDPGKGIKVKLRGLNEVMSESFTKLGLGMILATILVYLLMTTLFQSWLDPLIIMIAVPGSLAGVLWALALTGTTINVESLMGAIMAIGVAVSNSNLMINFMNDLRVEKNLDPAEAALQGGKIRLRPILMTAAAMILGMIPMAIGAGEAGSQNAPLGRAVIGGLIFSTITTLFVVPAAYVWLRKAMPTKHEIQKLYHEEAAPFEAAMKEKANA